MRRRYRVGLPSTIFYVSFVLFAPRFITTQALDRQASSRVPSVRESSILDASQSSIAV